MTDFGNGHRPPPCGVCPGCTDLGGAWCADFGPPPDSMLKVVTDPVRAILTAMFQPVEVQVAPEGAIDEARARRIRVDRWAAHQLPFVVVRWDGALWDVTRSCQRAADVTGVPQRIWRVVTVTPEGAESYDEWEPYDVVEPDPVRSVAVGGAGRAPGWVRKVQEVSNADSVPGTPD